MAKTKTKATKPSKKKKMQNHFRILVVDDSVFMRRMIVDELLSFGLTHIEQSENGKDAYLALQKAYNEGNPFSVLITGWNMPHMTGLELLQLCQNDPKYEEIISIMVTAVGDEESVLSVLAAGALDYLVKPFSREELKQKIEKILRYSGKMAS